ncbi:hypothetical protein ACHAWC_001213 [Mediolabrus comicus]
MKLKYIEEFMGLVSQCPALESHFNTSGQCSTSLASIHAAMSYGSFSSSAFVTGDVDPSSILCLVLGDGASPRTALAAAIKNGWTVVAIDENLDKSWVGSRDGLGNSSSAHRYVGFKGTMNDFLFEGRQMIHSSLQDAFINFRHLIIICLESTSSFDNLKTLRGRCGVTDLRVIYNNIPATVVSVSSPDLTQCPFQSTQACSYLDNCILSTNRHVKVWNFESSKRSFDASVPAATVTISTSSDTSSMTHNDNNSGGQDTAAVSLAYTRSSKVAQLQLQEALAAMKNAEMRSRQRSSPTTITLPSTTPSQETRHRRNKSSHKPVSSKLSLGIKSPIRFHRKRPSF